MNGIKKIYFIVALIMMSGMYAFGQTKGVKIVSSHPDIKLKITRCEATGKTVIIDYLVENINSKDIGFTVVTSVNYNTSTVAYDDEGNMYGSKEILIKLGNSNLEGPGPGVSGPYQILPSGIPMKGRIQISGVPESATLFRRIDLDVTSRELNLGDNPIRITNLPITREGDE